MKRIKNNFTLIELMVVMGLMVLMITLALPAFSKMSGNNKADIMTSGIKTALEQGQSTAVSRNCCVAVVFPSGTPTGSAADYVYGGYRLAEVEASGTSYSFVKWISENYQNKPDGAALVLTAAATDDAATPASGNSSSDTIKETLSISGKNDISYSDFLTVSSLPDGITGNSSVVFKPTGECVNASMYLYIAGADTSGTAPANIANNDFRLLRVNQFTGKVDYVER